jgi:PAS domain S-box-containing protein
MNRVMERLTGWRKADVLGKPLDQVVTLVNLHSANVAHNLVSKFMVEKQPVCWRKRRLLSLDGEERIVTATGAPIEAQRGDALGAVMIIRDISNLQPAEEEMFIASKQESINILAGGLAHDFNNLLSVITGNISLIKMLPDFSEPAQKFLEEAEKAAQQASGLTRQLMAFARGSSPVKATASVSELIQEIAGFSLCGSNVKCRIDMEADLWPVDMDKGQISQVINNLIINAVQAMPEGGDITIRAQNVTVTEKDGLPLTAGKYVRITVQDQGIGISEENLHRVFDPYFTTKANGFGLGLATSYTIIRNHDGHMEAQSQLNQGTTFHVYLPAASTEIPVCAHENRTPKIGSGTILIMDDEEKVREVAALMLEALGYRVLHARNGEEAVSIYRDSLAQGQQIDAVIMDLTIPGEKGGSETIGRLIALDPQVRAIVSSGYSNDPVISDFRSWGFKGALTKPYGITEISEVLYQVTTV